MASFCEQEPGIVESCDFGAIDPDRDILRPMLHGAVSATPSAVHTPFVEGGVVAEGPEAMDFDVEGQLFFEAYLSATGFVPNTDEHFSVENVPTTSVPAIQPIQSADDEDTEMEVSVRAPTAVEVIDVSSGDEGEGDDDVRVIRGDYQFSDSDDEEDSGISRNMPTNETAAVNIDGDGDSEGDSDSDSDGDGAEGDRRNPPTLIVYPTENKELSVMLVSAGIRYMPAFMGPRKSALMRRLRHAGLCDFANPAPRTSPVRRNISRTRCSLCTTLLQTHTEYLSHLAECGGVYEREAIQ